MLIMTTWGGGEGGHSEIHACGGTVSGGDELVMVWYMVVMVWHVIVMMVWYLVVVVWYVVVWCMVVVACSMVRAAAGLC